MLARAEAGNQNHQLDTGMLPVSESSFPEHEQHLMAIVPETIQSRGLDYFRNVVALVYREIGVLKTSNHVTIAAKINTAGGFFGQQRKVEAKKLYKLSLTDISVDQTLARYVKRTGLTLEDVYEAFQSGKWGTASQGFAFGGPRWAAITDAAIELGSAIRSKAWSEVEDVISRIDALQRNKGSIVGKFVQFDQRRGDSWLTQMEPTRPVGRGIVKPRRAAHFKRQPPKPEELVSLIDPFQPCVIQGVTSPSEFYTVLTVPGLLAGMKYPRCDFPWKTVADAGFTDVVSVHRGNYDPSPLVRRLIVQLEDLVHRGDPSDSQEETRLIQTVVASVTEAVRVGRGVVVHCLGGTGRSGTVIGCVLRVLGYGAEEVVPYLDRLHRARGKSGWPESPWQSHLVRTWDVQW